MRMENTLCLCFEDSYYEGKILEFKDNIFSMNKYGLTENGIYKKWDSKQLSTENAEEVFAQEDSESRLEKLHEFFPDAEYYATSVLFALED